MKTIICAAAMFAVVGASSALATDYYVATNGTDSTGYGLGTNTPFATLSYAVSTVSAGDTIYMRGGTYTPTASISLSKIGTAASPYRIRAYSGEHPILNFSSVGSGNDGIGLRGAYWQLYGLEMLGAPHNAIRIQGSSTAEAGSHNTIEFCSFHDCGNTGFSIGASTTPTTYLAGSNLVLNCDSYRNFDPNVGGNADGFSVKYQVGPDNNFVGCRAWENSDDGWDLFGAIGRVLIDTCWTWRNGSNVWGAAYNSTFDGNGNGFKMGGNFVATPHRLVRSVAYQNWGRPGKGGKGIDQNNNTGSLTIDNNTSWGNRVEDINMNTTPTTTGTITLRNNLVIGGTANIQASATQISNSWQVILSPPANSNDVLSMDASLLATPRQADGSLPVTALVHPVPNGRLVDKGYSFGDPYYGSAPDLGAYETGGGPPVATFTGTPTNGVAPLTVAFTDTSTGSPTNWAWNFGDAGTSTLQNPSHNYPTAGVYTVQLIASNAGGSSTNVKTAFLNIITVLQSWLNHYGVAADSADADGDGMSNTNEFVAGFNPTNNAAYPRIINIVKSGSDMNITYLGANGDTNYPGGPLTRTNVLECALVPAGGSFTNSFVGLKTNWYSNGTGLGTNVMVADEFGATNQPARYYRLRVLVP